MVGGLGERAALICDSVSNLIQSSPRPAGKSSGFCAPRKTVSVGAQTNQQCHNKHLFHQKQSHASPLVWVHASHQFVSLESFLVRCVLCTFWIQVKSALNWWNEYFWRAQDSIVFRTRHTMVYHEQGMEYTSVLEGKIESSSLSCWSQHFYCDLYKTNRSNEERRTVWKQFLAP